MPWYDREEGPTTPPKCPECERALYCAGCDPSKFRPLAKDLLNHGPWIIKSPLDRVEHVESADTDSIGIMIYVRTKESGDHVWVYWQSDTIDAWRPFNHFHGEPELRFIPGAYRDSTMMVIATKNTIGLPDFGSAATIAQAIQKKGAGWHVTHNPTGRSSITIPCADKAKARAELHRLGREYAKKLGVNYRIPEGN